ncbi:cobaltochelatase subunit CobN [Sediminitomix flava]|uniref:Cobaltochelatase CobN n=1 Tax=Sediminitomix flava TaxID=379075 RepID=A0A315Z8H9_SEDFL|nr:cobaltochelatase subunit CobN [Sediminitomix flava]PWJ41886.1 cobaltochelatase CobN [Sediminitomix flava]
MKSKFSIWKKLGIGAFLIILIGFAYFYYAKNVSPTKVAFINYQGFQLSRINKSNTNSWIQIDELKLDELDKARDYKAIFLFGRGFQMSPEEKQQLENAGYSGVHLFMEAATNPNVDVTNLKGSHLDMITDYFKFGGTQNYNSMLTYVRQNLDGKKWFIETPKAPQPIPNDVFIHLDEDKLFTEFPAYDTYLKENGFHKEGQPKVALITSVPGPFNANRDHIDDLIGMLEQRNLNVYTISAATKRLEFLKAVDPDLVILMPHGRLTLGQSEEAIAWLKEKNIPMLSPLSVFQEYEKWVDDPQGFDGSLLSMSVVLPELDGGINPYAIIAQYKDENGYLSFQVVPERLQKFGDMVEDFLLLKKKENKEKKVAIYYFKGPGLNSMVAANMEVVPSLFNTLKELKANGYKVDNLPNSSDELWEMIKKQGAVLGPYAKGAFDTYLKEGNPALVDTDTYESWVEKDLKSESYQAVVEKYGKAPGEYLSTSEGDKDYLAVARLEFGNVALLPQPLSGVGKDTFKLVHGAKVAPPHPYIASYLWTRNEFKADAIIHLGTHGSLEFTPGKQVALSGYDWTDALIGTTPHFYIYTISNVGEGIIAKRRSYATTLSYLTPPFMESELTGDLKKLSDQLNTFSLTKGAVKEEYKKGITKLAQKLELHKDLALDSVNTFSEDELFKLSNYVEEVRNSKVTGGLYTLGNAYNQDQKKNTVLLMALDPIAYSLATLDKIEGKVSQKQLDDALFFDRQYRQKAKKLIEKVLYQGQNSTQVLEQYISKSDLEKAKAWVLKNKGMSDAEIIKGFIGMGTKSAKKKHPHAAKKKSNQVGQKEIDELKRLVIAISPYPERKDFILNLKSDKQFKQSSGILDPQTLEKAKKIAKAIPAMAKAIEIGQQEDVFRLLKMMQKEPLRQMTFKLMEDESLAEQVAQEKIKKEEELLAQFSDAKNVRTLQYVSPRTKLPFEQKEVLMALPKTLKMYQKNWDFIIEKNSEALSVYTSKEGFKEQLSLSIERIELVISELNRKEAEWVKAVLAIEENVNSIKHYEQSLAISTAAETQAILNGLNGGYIAPSSGGDPITNPATVPTGRNLYSIDAQKTPSPEAWNVGKDLAKNLLSTHFKKHGKYPQKISFTLWPGDFIETEGAMVAQIFYLLGVEPVRDPFKRVMDIRLIPEKELDRPRIDVVVQTAGQFRDLAASRMYLINKAVAMAAEAKDTQENFVKKGVLDAERYMKENGLSPKQAREWATQRVFGGQNNTYGTNIMGMVEDGSGWNDEAEIAETYLNNMGAIYDKGENWGAFQKGVFEAALQNTEVVVQPRESNTWGGLSLDHVYEFMGGLSMAVRHVTGEDPDAYFNDFRNPSKAKVQDLKEALWVEARSTLLNPKYIKEYMKGGASSAESFAETFRNTYGWNVMKPKEIDNSLWNNLYDVYVEDQLNLNVQAFFERENPYALEEMTAVMLETIRKGYWKASEQQIAKLSELHTELIQKHNAGCSGFVCDNTKLKSFISEQLSEENQQAYASALEKVREVQTEVEGMVLEKETLQADETNDQPKNAEESSDQTILFLLIGIVAVVIFVVAAKRVKNG